MRDRTYHMLLGGGMVTAITGFALVGYGLTRLVDPDRDIAAQWMNPLHPPNLIGYALVLFGLGLLLPLRRGRRSRKRDGGSPDLESFLRDENALPEDPDPEGLTF